jgi:hypothetical protein
MKNGFKLLRDISEGIIPLGVMRHKRDNFDWHSDRYRKITGNFPEERVERYENSVFLEDLHFSWQY